MTNDHINSLFELVGALILILNVRRLYLDKQLRGVTVWPVMFYTLWGVWNLFYYPSLGQWWSVSAGALLSCINIVWISLAIKYRKN